MRRALRRIVLIVAMGALASVMFSVPLLAQDFASVFEAAGNVKYSKYYGLANLGSIEVRTKKRTLYFVVGQGKAIRYSVGVGRIGQQWFGSTKIASKHLRPAWVPPAVIRRGKPAWIIPSGSALNPMGAAALVLADHELAIHGTNDPRSIGGYVSWGCIRMRNQDIMDLYSRVTVGARVVFKP